MSGKLEKHVLETAWGRSDLPCNHPGPASLQHTKRDCRLSWWMARPQIPPSRGVKPGNIQPITASSCKTVQFIHSDYMVGGGGAAGRRGPLSRVSVLSVPQKPKAKVPHSCPRMPAGSLCDRGQERFLWGEPAGRAAGGTSAGISTF